MKTDTATTRHRGVATISGSSLETGLLARCFEPKDYPGVTSQWLLFFAGCWRQLDPTYLDALLQDFDGFARGYDTEEIMAKIKCPSQSYPEIAGPSSGGTAAEGFE